MTDKYEFLANHPVFQHLDDDELLALSQLSQAYDFDQGSVIAYQRDSADALYLVQSGRLYARALDAEGRVREANTRHFLENDFFGAEWLFDTGTHQATVTATDPGRLLVITGDRFRQFLRVYPDALQALEPEYDRLGQWSGGLPETAWEDATKLSLIEHRDRIGPIRLLPDELVEFYARRSKYYLLEAVFWPVLGLILVPMLAFALMPDDSTVWRGIRTFIIVATLLLFLFVVIYRLLDWRNDYFVVTNKHISHREFHLRTFRTQLNKVPIEQIQSVTVDRPTLTANLFNVGTVRITTAAQVGTILFESIDDPLEVKDILNRLRQRGQAVDAALAQTDMRQSVEQHFQLEKGFKEVESPNGEQGDGLLTIESQHGLLRRLRLLVEWRIEEDNVITYRRNRLLLFLEVIGPLVVITLLLAIGVAVARYTTLSNSLVVLVLLPFLAISLFWLVWMFEDWRNDTFQLTDRYVIDIDRKPFGFGESRKQAALQNIQNVSAERPGFLATIFDYGDVIIETAGATADITFDRVPEPSRVLSDIFRRLDEYRQAQRRREGIARREEYAVLLDVYKQELEQGRIPRRTPRD